MPCAINSPHSPTTSAVRSCSPAEDPAMIVTRSHSLAARSHGVAERGQIVARARILYRRSAPLAHKAASTVELKSITAPGLASSPGWINSSPVGMMPTLGRAFTATLVVWPAASSAPKIVRAQPVGARQEQFRGDHILAHQTDVVPRRHRLENLHRALIDLMHLFDHDHRIGPRRQAHCRYRHI